MYLITKQIIHTKVPFSNKLTLPTCFHFMAGISSERPFKWGAVLGKADDKAGRWEGLRASGQLSRQFLTNSLQFYLSSRTLLIHSYLMTSKA